MLEVQLDKDGFFWSPPLSLPLSTASVWFDKDETLVSSVRIWAKLNDPRQTSNPLCCGVVHVTNAPSGEDEQCHNSHHAPGPCPCLSNTNGITLPASLAAFLLCHLSFAWCTMYLRLPINTKCQTLQKLTFKLRDSIFHLLRFYILRNVDCENKVFLKTFQGPECSHSSELLNGVKLELMAG